MTETRTFNSKVVVYVRLFELAAEATDIRVSENGQPISGWRTSIR